ncbi:hypothetical protein HY572_02485 [Candidatus Micrarchaeota archaeon]|nr:hypothetical protein [Candidatus Micrarchaeota archaeon]
MKWTRPLQKAVKWFMQPLRRRKSAEIRYFRELDRASFQGIGHPGLGRDKYYTDSGLDEYSEHFKTDLAQVAEQLHRERGHAIRVLDVGAGDGLFGIQLQDHVGPENVELHTTGLARPFNQDRKTRKWSVQSKALDRETQQPWNRFASYNVGVFTDNADQWFDDEHFDLIVDHSGMLKGQAAVGLMAKKLRAGGHAYLMGEFGNVLQLGRLRRTLSRQGIAMELIRGATVMNAVTAIRLEKMR